MPLGRTSTRPRPASAAASASTSSAIAATAPVSAARSAKRTLTSRCGSFSIAWRPARSPPSSDSSVSSAAAIPSPDGHEARVDDVARLLAAERPAALAQRLEHVAVARRGSSPPRRRRRASRCGSRSSSSPSPPRRRRAGGRRSAGAARRARSARRRRRPRRRGRPRARGRRRRRTRSRRRGRPRARARRAPSTCVEPQPALMLRPSGASASTSTSAPRRRKISGAARCVAPLAQSSAIRSPLRSSPSKRSCSARR